eukprot:5803193-Amphidinium_carterae.1
MQSLAFGSHRNVTYGQLLLECRLWQLGSLSNGLPWSLLLGSLSSETFGQLLLVSLRCETIAGECSLSQNSVFGSLAVSLRCETIAGECSDSLVERQCIT